MQLQKSTIRAINGRLTTFWSSYSCMLIHKTSAAIWYLFYRGNFTHPLASTAPASSQDMHAERCVSACETLTESQLNQLKSIRTRIRRGPNGDHFAYYIINHVWPLMSCAAARGRIFGEISVEWLRCGCMRTNSDSNQWVKQRRKRKGRRMDMHMRRAPSSIMCDDIFDSMKMTFFKPKWRDTDSACACVCVWMRVISGTDY